MDSADTVESQTRRKRPLLEKLGGLELLEEVVDIFCERVISDPYLVDFFHGVNVDRFKAHQLGFMRTALGEQSETAVHVRSRNIRHIYESHRRLFERGLNVTHFDAVVDHMLQTLKELHVRRKYIKEMRSQVLLPFREIFVKGGE